jgi:hypothetical protein
MAKQKESIGKQLAALRWAGKTPEEKRAATAKASKARWPKKKKAA